MTEVPTSHQEGEVPRVPISEMIDSSDIFEAEISYLMELKKHAKALKILAARAKLSAYGTGKRDPETGFIDRGCGNGCCVKQYDKALARSWEADRLYHAERNRIFQKHEDHEEILVVSLDLEELEDNQENENE